MTGGTLQVNNSSYVGYSGIGTFTQSNGVNAANNLYLGYNSGSSGAYSLSGTGQVSGGWECVGYSGTGNFTQSGGTNVISNNGGFYLGYNSGSSGNYTVSGTGQLSGAYYEYVGYSGTGPHAVRRD